MEEKETQTIYRTGLFNFSFTPEIQTNLYILYLLTSVLLASVFVSCEHATSSQCQSSVSPDRRDPARHASLSIDHP